MPDQTPDTRASLSQAYIELVGYCPFADDPSATVDSVRALLTYVQALTHPKAYRVEVVITERYTVQVEAVGKSEARTLAEELITELDDPTNSPYFNDCTGFTAGNVDEVTE